MTQRCLASLALLWYAAGTWAAQLTPTLDGGQIGLRVDSSAYPEALAKDLTSGLTNRVLIRVTLARGNHIVGQRALEIAIRYDLWDERFATSMTVDGIATQPPTIQNAEEMLAFLRRLQLPRLFAANGFGNQDPLTLTADILLNPVNRERMEMIRKWVAENSIGPGDVAGHSASGTLALAIFNRIFEQYAKGADVAAIWRETSTSRPFRLDELADESR